MYKLGDCCHNLQGEGHVTNRVSQVIFSKLMC